MRTTLDITDEAYYLAKSIAQDQNRSLGQVVGGLILKSVNEVKGAPITMSDYGFPTFRCLRPVTSEDVRALDEVSYRELPSPGTAGYKQVTDAYLALLARQHGGTVATMDPALAAVHAGTTLLP